MMIGFLGVVSMTLVGTAVTVEDKNAQGSFLCWVLYVKLAFNSVLILVVTFFSIKDCLKKLFRKRRQTIQNPKVKDSGRQTPITDQRDPLDKTRPINSGQRRRRHSKRELTSLNKTSLSKTRLNPSGQDFEIFDLRE